MRHTHESDRLEADISPGPPRPISPNVVGKKLLFVTRIFEFGGAEKHLIDLIRRMPQPGLHISILCIGADYCSERLDPNLKVNVIERAEMPVSVADWIQLFREAQPDTVVFIYGTLGAFPWIGSVGCWLAGVRKRFSIQHLVLPTERKQNAVRRMVRQLIGPLKVRLAAHLFYGTICVSNELKSSLINDFGFPANKVRVIHNGVSLSEFAPSKTDGAGIRTKLNIGPDEFVLVCAARLNHQKGIDTLLAAMGRVVRDGVNCKCIIVGDGPLKEPLMKQTLDLALSSCVFFEGFHEDVRPYLHAASAFVLTSRREGLPLAILEAMACGLPCIVTDVGGNAEAVTNEAEGLVVAPESIDAAAAAISYLATHPRECEQMSKNARARACQEFDIEKSMAEIKSVILS